MPKIDCQYYNQYIHIFVLMENVSYMFFEIIFLIVSCTVSLVFKKFKPQIQIVSYKEILVVFF